MRYVVVFDTNVLLSAVGWKGRPHECVELARRGVIQGITCWELLDELSETLQTKLSFDLAQSNCVLVDLLTFLQIAPITGQLRVVASDPDDDKTVECALVAGAMHIVTGDRRHLLPLRQFQGIEIVTAAEMVALVAATP